MGWGLAPGQSWLDLAQFAAALAAGGFAFWKWGLEETRQARRELPHIVVKPTVAFVQKLRRGNLHALSLELTNPGKLPFGLDHESSKLALYVVPPGLTGVGAIGLDDKWCVSVERLYPDAVGNIEFEPGAIEQHSVPVLLPPKATCVLLITLNIKTDARVRAILKRNNATGFYGQAVRLFVHSEPPPAAAKKPAAKAAPTP